MWRRAGSLACPEWMDGWAVEKVYRGHASVSLKCEPWRVAAAGLVVWETREGVVRIILLRGGVELAWESGSRNGKGEKPGGP